MIPRILVPPDARPTTLIATPGRPTALDERTLIPGYMTTGPLEEKSQIPPGLPLDSITARVVVPRDAKILPYNAPALDDPTAKPSTLDERIAVPVGARPPEDILAAFTRPENLVEGDVFTTGEVQFLVTPANRAEKTRDELVHRVTTAVVYILILIALRITPDFHRQKLRTSDDIARKNVTLLLPPGPLDIPAPVRPPQPRIQVNPNVLRKIAPPSLPTPIPQPEPQPQPKQELPNAPTAQTNPAPPAPQPKTEVAANNPLKLEMPDTPKPQQGLILPKYGNTRPADSAPQRQSPGISGPRATIQSVPLPRSLGGGGGGQSGRAYGGMAMLTPDQGVDFSVYLARVQASVDRNWQAVIPESVQLGEKGWVELQFKIMRDGSVPQGYPILIRSSSKEPLDRAAISSIRASNPFEPLPPAFTGPFIELRAIYLYNLPPEILNQQ